jgi:hypothetical protein
MKCLSRSGAARLKRNDYKSPLPPNTAPLLGLLCFVKNQEGMMKLDKKLDKY